MRIWPSGCNRRWASRIHHLWPEVTITIPTYYTHEQLIESFAAYLRLHFPLQGKAGKKSGRKVRIGNGRRCRRSSLATQRAPIFIRLSTAQDKERCSGLEFEDLGQQKLCQQPYHSESAIDRAKALAKKHLARFEEFGVSTWEE